MSHKVVHNYCLKMEHIHKNIKLKLEALKNSITIVKKRETFGLKRKQKENFPNQKANKNKC